MKLYKFPYNEKVAQEFSKQVLPIIEITKKNNEQNRELAMQRDKLLPLLMNGQVSLNSDLSNRGVSAISSPYFYELISGWIKGVFSLLSRLYHYHQL